MGMTGLSCGIAWAQSGRVPNVTFSLSNPNTTAHVHTYVRWGRAASRALPRLTHTLGTSTGTVEAGGGEGDGGVCAEWVCFDYYRVSCLGAPGVRDLSSLALVSTAP